MGGKRETTNGKAGTKILQFRKNVEATFQVEYMQLDPELVLNAVDSCARAGAAIMFGKTSDGGAYSVMVLYNNEKVKEYPHSVDEMHSVLQAIVAQIGD